MATEQHKRKKSSNNRTSQSKSNNNKNSSNRKKVTSVSEEGMDKALFQDEITLIVTLVISLLLLLSNFNLSGKVGEAINDFTFGLVGLIAYLLPFLLFFAIAFYIANRGNRMATRKLISGISLGVILTALIHLIAGINSSAKISEFYKESARVKNGGGIIGGAICKLLYPLFGTVGTYIILIALLVVLFMLFTGKAVFAYLGSKSGASLQQMRERRLQREEEYLESQSSAGGDFRERRPARTVLLKKKQDEMKDSDSLDSNTDVSNESLFGNIKKKMSKNNKSVDQKNDHFDMEEITAFDVDSIPIQRADNYYNGTSSSDKNNSYEEQLNMKFGKNKDDGTSYTVTAERPNIDDDIAKLLKAAEHDQAEQINEMMLEHSAFQMEVGNASDSTVVDNIKDSKNTDGKANQSTSVPPTDQGMNDQTNTKKVDSSNTETLQINQVLEEKKEYKFPSFDLLTKPKNDVKGMSDKDLKETAVKLQKTLESFGVRVTITNVSCGPAVTRYELQPEQGVKVSKITGLADDIKLNLAAADVRIEAPIPGKAAVGIEVPNKENATVLFRELLEGKEFKKHPSDIAFAVGKDIGGQTIVTDIGKMPHLLIAGATGSGKSVCINTLIMSILYKAKPSDVRLIMVDPKVVELSVYNGIPHLLIPVVTDPKKASAALNWAVMEMTERYKKFADLGVRDVKGYNEKIATVEEYNDERYQKLPQIVIIVDELADLMMVAPGEVEDAICRLAQMARAAGLHLIIATQRPSVNVITGLIKANIPSRIAFSVSSAIDSRTILDGSGAEKLLGKGDMLFFPSGFPKPIRVQGAFVSDKEVGAVVEFLTSQNSTPVYSEEVTNKITSATSIDSGSSSPANDRDDYFIEAGKFIIEKDKASIGMLQRVYKIGFNRAARIMDQLADAGVVGPEEGTKPRKVLMSLEEFEQFVDEYV